MPKSRRPGWIDWAKSAAKQIILDDLDRGVLPVDEAELSAEEAWDLVYSQMYEFIRPETVVFSQFKERLRDHRKKQGALVTRAAWESEALAHDRRLFPRRTENNRGEPVFDLSAAKLLLRADVAEGKQNRMTPGQLQKSRVEYEPFSTVKFKHRIYQEVRRQKFINYLNMRREQGKRD
jgi:hypothetical protein